MALLQQWISETTCSGLPTRIKELSCYLTIAQWCQSHNKTLQYENTQQIRFDLAHAKTISLSCILTGDPGSYKSEAVRFIKKTLVAYNDIVLGNLGDTLRQPIPLYPHDSVTREMMLSTLSKESEDKPDEVPTVTTVVVDELVNFLNRREYVEPLIGTLNSLLDQPPAYAAGTQKRGTENINRPIVSLLAACAPSWFKYLPEALFTGGFTGRCLFYAVPYPTRAERQPLGQVAYPGAAQRLAQTLYYLPQSPLVLSPEAINWYTEHDMKFGDQRVHPLQAIDEWFKRRAVLTVRLAACIALAHCDIQQPDKVIITLEDMHEANTHMEHVLITLEHVWEELDSDDSLRFKVLTTGLLGQQLTDAELLDLAVSKMRNTQKALSILQYMKHSGILQPVTGTRRWQVVSE